MTKKPKSLYSLLDYRNIVYLIFFTKIKPDKHYIEHHQKDVQWPEVVEVILTTKNKRKKRNRIEIKTNKYYILCKLKNKILWVINAKRLR